MTSTNDFSFLQSAYSQYSLENDNIANLAAKHSRLKEDVENTSEKSNTSSGFIGGGYVTAIGGSILVIIVYLIHVTLGGFEPLSNLKGLKHLSKIFTTNKNGKIVANGMLARNGVSAFFKLLIYVGLIVMFTTIASELMIKPHNQKYRQYNRERSRLMEERDKAQRELDEAQRKLDSSSA